MIWRSCRRTYQRLVSGVSAVRACEMRRRIVSRCSPPHSLPLHRPSLPSNVIPHLMRDPAQPFPHASARGSGYRICARVARLVRHDIRGLRIPLKVSTTLGSQYLYGKELARRLCLSTTPWSSRPPSRDPAQPFPHTSASGSGYRICASRCSSCPA